jgi:pimeloyl-ACP methyl ester carboxylesterase
MVRRSPTNASATDHRWSRSWERCASGGALCERGAALGVANELAADFTVYCYDRRGRGDSGNTLPYAVDREIEDVAAMIGAAGGEAAVYGHSSGAVLALYAAAARLPITKVAAYEPPFVVEGTPPQRSGFAERVDALIAAGRPGDAVEVFMREGPHIPDEVIAGMKAGPGWAYFERIGPTVAYDIAVVGAHVVPSDRLSTISVPTLVLAGGASPEPMRQAAQAVADAVTASQHVVVDGQEHNADPAMLAPPLRTFFQA